MGLYHASVGFPAWFSLAGRFGPTVRLTPTQHALHAREDDRYGLFDIPNLVSLSQLEAFELDTVKDRIAVRIPAGAGPGRDLCLVLRPLTRDQALVITAWTNMAADRHDTLNRARYDRP